MRRVIVDQDRFEWLEEQAGERAGTLGAGVVAGVAAQFLQHQFGARHVLAAQHAALELRHQQRARLGAEIPEILPQTLDESPVGHTHHSPLVPGSKVIAGAR